MTITPRGGVDNRELDKTESPSVPSTRLTGLSLCVANATHPDRAPKRSSSPLVQQLPKLGADSPLRHDDAGA